MGKRPVETREGWTADAMVIVNDGSVCPSRTNDLTDNQHLSFRCSKNNSEERIANSVSGKETVNDIAGM